MAISKISVVPSKIVLVLQIFSIPMCLHQEPFNTTHFFRVNAGKMMSQTNENKRKVDTNTIAFNSDVQTKYKMVNGDLILPKQNEKQDQVERQTKARGQKRGKRSSAYNFENPRVEMLRRRGLRQGDHCPVRNEYEVRAAGMVCVRKCSQDSDCTNDRYSM